jgi:hypothetical protein
LHTLYKEHVSSVVGGPLTAREGEEATKRGVGLGAGRSASLKGCNPKEGRRGSPYRP